MQQTQVKALTALHKTAFFILLNYLAGSASAQTLDVVPGEVIVRLKAGVSLNGHGASLRSGTSFNKLVAELGLQKASPLLTPARRSSADASDLQAFSSVYKLQFSDKNDLRAIVRSLSELPDIIYAQPNHVLRLDGAPNDPRFPQQTALTRLEAAAAWDLQIASPDVVVGVIDTGIDYGHEDLAPAIWLNSGEDLNANGKVDSTDFNGIDDDGNGFIDDIRGWDFTDAPAFPDGGDFQTRDNDPFDENGHGTSVAGLIGAVGDNNLGIAGLAYGCRIMALRAGTSLGLLEEDDVASAIIYAVKNGARVINMSFGDEVASPLLRDVIRFAFARNCILVASSGNSASQAIHFPSGFQETISVGATTDNDILASFSNYGSSMDIVAPGAAVLTTQRSNKYGEFTGTSASAPLVSALAALILSKIPQLSNEAVKGLLLSTATDLGSEGWDNFYAAGRINPLLALKSPAFALAEITAPALDQGFSSCPVHISGTAFGAGMTAFSLSLGAGETPAEWSELLRVQQLQIIDKEMLELDISDLPDSTYTLRLTAHSLTHPDIEDKVRFFIDRTPPVISNLRQTDMLDADRPAVLLEFDTDDVCDAAVFFRPQNSGAPFQEKKLRFRGTEHRMLLTQEDLAGHISFYLTGRNGAGAETVADNQGLFFSADLSTPALGGLPVDKLDMQFQSGFLLSKTADFDGDGRQEIILNEYDAEANFSVMKILEFLNGGFTERFVSDGLYIPRDFGDSDGDGLPEILTGRGSDAFIFEAAAAGGVPNQIVWQGETNHWAVRFANFDEDGQGEVILRAGDLYTVWESLSEIKYAQVDSFPNPTSGSNATGVPHAEIADFDGDGKLEILMGDADGDIYIYENVADNRSAATWSDRLPLVDATDFLTHGDYDGDGVDEFVVGCHSDPNLNLESNFDSRYWLYRVYQREGDNTFAPAWQQAFFGFQSPRTFDSGVSSGDVDNDGTPEILISAFPDFYIVDYEATLAEYKVIWHAQPARSNAVLTADLDEDQNNEFYFNTGTATQGFSLLTGFSGPATPTGFVVRPLDLSQIELSWQHAGAPLFRVYRGATASELMPLHVTDNLRFVDDSVQNGVDYWYAVTAVDSALTSVESRRSPVLGVRPTARPFVTTAFFQHPNQVILSFSEAMNNSIADQTNFEVTGFGSAVSAAIHRSGQEVLLTFPRLFQPGTYSVSAANVMNLNGTPIDPARNSVTFEVTERAASPYLVKATLLENNQLLLEFSEPMENATTSEVTNYEFLPPLTVLSAQQESNAPEMVTLEIEAGGKLGPSGKEHILRVRNVRSQTGAAIRFGYGDSAALIFSSPDLANIFAYPNPFRANATQDFVTIAGLTENATVRILDISGRLIRTLLETDGNGGIAWDLRDKAGKAVASGIYVIYATNAQGQKGMGKLAVIR